jgi:hypothetical protein
MNEALLAPNTCGETPPFPNREAGLLPCAFSLLSAYIEPEQDSGTQQERNMTTENKPIINQVQVGSILGPIWFIGWLFTWAFAGLAGWQILFSLFIWPYYLGLAAR